MMLLPSLLVRPSLLVNYRALVDACSAPKCNLRGLQALSVRSPISRGRWRDALFEGLFKWSFQARLFSPRTRWIALACDLRGAQRAVTAIASWRGRDAVLEGPFGRSPGWIQFAEPSGDTALRFAPRMSSEGLSTSTSKFCGAKQRQSHAVSLAGAKERYRRPPP
jgi:hypothetical protein